MPRSLLHALALRLGAVSMAAVVLTALLPAAATASSGGPILLGSAGDAEHLADLVDEPLHVHRYGQLSGGVPTGRMLNIALGVTWRTVINAEPGSPTHDHMVRWANTLKARGTETIVAFSHEPEAAGSEWLGTPDEFIEAFRAFRSIFESRDVKNVEFTWQMTAYSFRVPPNDPRHYLRWYPGDRWVDNVAVDAYNWYDCEHGSGIWKELKSLIDPAVRFARSHDKQFVLGEFASQSGPRRDEWIANAQEYFEENREIVHAVFWFQRIDGGHPDCRWVISSEDDIAAYKAMAAGPIFNP